MIHKNLKGVRALFRKIATLSIGIFMVISLIAMVHAPPAVAATRVWSRAAGNAGDWSTGSNWGGTEPASGDYSKVNNNGIVNITQPSEATYDLTLGQFAGTTGTVNMTSGNLTVYYETLGQYGTGTFTQSGGTNKVTGSLYLGDGAGSKGSYSLSGTGILDTTTTAAQYIGSNGTGTFTQTGGTNQGINITVGFYSGLSGTYTQSGGTVRITSTGLMIGSEAGAAGTYILSGGDLSSSASEYIGKSGSGRFVQTGGTNRVGVGNVYIGAGASGSGTYELKGGTFISNVGMTVRQDAGASGTLMGYGSPTVTYSALVNNGRVIADGYGAEQTLSLANVVNGIGNTMENPTTGGTNGWFAQNKGKLTLKALSITGNGSYNWGEAPSDTTIDLVNSARFTFAGESGASGSLTMSLLSLDRTSDIHPLATSTLISYYNVVPASFTATSTNIIFRYDDLLAGSHEANLKIYRYNGSAWADVTSSVDTTNNWLTTTSFGSVAAFTGDLAIGYDNNMWQATTDDWSTSGSWTTGVPTSSDAVSINNGGTVSITTAGAAAANLYLAQNSGDSGNINMTGGTLTTTSESISTSGAGTFTQSGDTNIAATLGLATGTGGNGTYTLSGGALSVTNAIAAPVGTSTLNIDGGTFTLTANSMAVSNLNIGNSSGSNATYTQTGGTYKGISTFSVGNLSGSSGTYSVSGGFLSAPTEYIGNSGKGTLIQSGGTNQTATIYIGNSSGSSGTYTQSGGTNTVTSAFYVGNNSTSEGSYFLSGTGLIDGTNATENIGSTGTGAFTQTGGTNQAKIINVGNNNLSNGTYTQSGGTAKILSGGAGSLNVGNASGSSGSYNLSGTGYIDSKTLYEYIGNLGKGTFTQTGGTNDAYQISIGYNGAGANGTYTQSAGVTSVKGTLTIGSAAGATGVYSLSGTGLLDATGKTEYIGASGKGTFTQTGGTNQAGVIILGNNVGSSGTYDLQGGYLKATTITRGSGTSAFNFTGGTLSVNTFNGALNVQSGGTLSPGNSPGLTTINGNFTNSGTIIFELGGIGGTPGQYYDTIDVNGGDVSLDGTLRIAKYGTWSIAEGNTFNILSWDLSKSFTDTSSIDNQFGSGSFTKNVVGTNLVLTFSFGDLVWNTTTGNWSSASSWNPQVIPQATNNVAIDATSAVANIGDTANAKVVTIGTGTLNLNSGGTLNATSINNIAGTGTINMDGGMLALSSNDISIENFNVGNAASTTGSFTLASGKTLTAGNVIIGNSGTGILTLSGDGLSGGNLVVRNTSDVAGIFQGQGAVGMTGTLTNNGRIIADGGTLDMSGFASVTNTIDNTTTNGWFATNQGKLTLPAIQVASGAHTYTWGENPGDEAPSLVFGSVDIIFRYDELLLNSLGILPADLTVYHYGSDNLWHKFTTTSIDEVNKLVTITGGTSFTGFSLGNPYYSNQGDPEPLNSVPEPATVVSIISGIFMLGYRRLLKRRGCICKKQK
jgi:hypothetical protein